MTDSPVTEYDNRSVLDRGEFTFDRVGQWRSLDLTGEKPEHRFLLRMKHAGLFTEMNLKIVLHGKLRNSVVIRNRSDLMIDRLWLSRNYFHGDLGRACFRSTPSVSDFEGKVWFASLEPGTPRIAQESEYSFTYGRASSGKIDLALHDGVRYILAWRAHHDGAGRDYRTSWFRGNELLSETIESVYPFREAIAAGCLSLRLGGYCDTDDI